MNSLLEQQIKEHLSHVEPNQLESMRDFLDTVSKTYDSNASSLDNDRQSAKANNDAIMILSRAMRANTSPNSYTSYILHSDPKQEVIRLANLVSGIISDYKNNTDELTVQKNNADRLSHELQTFKIAVDDSADLITFFDENLHFIYANKAALADTGFGNVIGKSIGEVGKKITSESNLNNYLSHLKNNEDGFMSEMVVDGPLGEPMTYQTMTTVVRDINGRKIGINISRDITREKSLKLQKDEFISIASHELRTPMTVVLGYISLLQREQLGPINDQQKDVLDKMNRNSKTLIKLINDMLDLSKLEANKFEIDLKDYKIDDLVNNTIEEMKLVCDHKRLSIDYINNDITVTTDEDKFKRILSNLLDNACKFTPEEGSITVSSEADFDQKLLVICVADTGIGIPAASQKNLFQKFSQVNSVLHRQSGGTGLGLSICKDIVEKLGGSIWVKSAPDTGSKFYFTIPISTNKNDKSTINEL
jgi:PAS domain S-box-containing protein